MNFEVQLDNAGLMPAIVQDSLSGEVLTLAYLSPDSLKRTLESGYVWFYSRSRQQLWNKGEISGNYLKLQSIVADCDGDAILLKVDPMGPACHTGASSCFHNLLHNLPSFQFKNQGSGIIEELFAIIRERQLSKSNESYTAELLSQGIGRVAQKVVEEAGESAIAAVGGNSQELTNELSDLIYHMLVLIAAADLNPEEIWKELRNRRQTR
ncbi:bifunctional phosphoribosyl-AMP cyclohydrolase/phosphoribosyl-ATP diphosphatase HisIE [SAR202 cluster bacterium AD-802-E10_MRT_200m]|nr:bifunctional phosphoribosyl-AMP cyclohydrolase/phosphoribosyl-ATP diphosphatase HisIE [SAR202 cluster bacterium AD-802-E10_MRT_200m]